MAERQHGVRIAVDRHCPQILQPLPVTLPLPAHRPLITPDQPEPFLVPYRLTMFVYEPSLNQAPEMSTTLLCFYHAEHNSQIAASEIHSNTFPLMLKACQEAVGWEVYMGTCDLVEQPIHDIVSSHGITVTISEEEQLTQPSCRPWKHGLLRRSRSPMRRRSRHRGADASAGELRPEGGTPLQTPRHPSASPPL